MQLGDYRLICNRFVSLIAVEVHLVSVTPKLRLTSLQCKEGEKEGEKETKDGEGEGEKEKD